MVHKFRVLGSPFLGHNATFARSRQHGCNLVNLLPPHIGAVSRRTTRVCTLCRDGKSLVRGHRFLVRVFGRGQALFFGLVIQRVSRFVPVICSPMVTRTVRHCGRQFVRPRSTTCLAISSPSAVRRHLRGTTSRQSVHLVIIASTRNVLKVDS